eukprot:7225370-Alexandrium_andersonii.AAC.1
MTIATPNPATYLDASTHTSGSPWSDSSGNYNHGTIVGATFSQSNNGVFHLDGSDDYISTSCNMT